MGQPGGPRRRLVLVGGGHAHVQVLRRLAMDRLPPTAVTLVVDTPIAVYSGMVTGLVAGEYRRSEAEIDTVPLARRAGARVVVARMTGLDPDARRIDLEGRPPLAYDVASLDIGSSVAGLGLPGVRAHAVPSRPIHALVERVESLVAGAIALPGSRPLRVVVVGGGAAGVELAFVLDRRLRDALGASRATEVTLLHAGPRLVEQESSGLARRLAARAAARQSRSSRESA